MTRIRIAIVAAVRLYRDGLADALGTRERLEVVGTGADPASAHELVQALAPDVVLLDAALPGGLDAVRTLSGARPGLKVVVLAIRDAEDDVIACAEAGAAGYVTRDQSLAELVAAIETVARGEMLCSPRMAAMLMRRVTALAADSVPPTDGRLTARELEVVELIGQGLSNKVIAQRLSIELATVKNHVHNILEKLQVRRRSDAVARVRAAPRQP